MGKSEMMERTQEALLSPKKRAASTKSQAQAQTLSGNAFQNSPLEPTWLESWDPALFEVACARHLNIELPQDIPQAVALIEQRVTSLFQADSCVLLSYDEASCIYTCLNDLKDRHQRSRELTLIDDHFLQEWLGCPTVLQATLLALQSPQSAELAEGVGYPPVSGLVALGRHEQRPDFSAQEELMLDLAMPYLARLVQSLKTLVLSISLPYTQSVVLEVSNRLISAVDQETVLVSVLESLENRLQIDGCQYVSLQLESDREDGEVLFESFRGGMKNYTKPHRKHGKKAIPRLMSLMSLFQSSVRRMPYLLLNHEMLGDYPLSDWFGVEGVQGALVLPIMDVSTNKPVGLLNLFNVQSAYISPDIVDIGKQISVLVSLALGRVRHIEQTLVLATSDELTGLTNRRGFYERFEMEIERSRRNPSSMCVALIDVDYFKKLNDTRGHLSGDLVLQHLAETLNNNVRKSDMVCRFGGEEFVLLLPDTGEKAAFDLLERIRRKVAKNKIMDAQGEPVKITISAGVTVVNTQDYASVPRQIMDDAIEEADRQLYRAKEISRNRVCSTRIDPGVVQCELPFLKRH